MAPAGFRASLLSGGVPAFVFVLIAHLTVPRLEATSIPLAVSVVLQFVALFGGLGLAAIALTWPRNPGDEATVARLRLKRPRVSHAVWGVSAGAAALLCYRALGDAADWLLANTPSAWQPEWLGRFLTSDRMLDLPLPGNPWPLVLYSTIYVCNVAGEEIYWRGYLLARQELAFGRHAWLVNAAVWNLFHLAFFWNMVALVPACLLIAWVAQRTRSTWPGLVAHAILNAPAFAPILRGMAGHG